MKHSIYLLALNDRAFRAISEGKKRIEIRAGAETPVDYPAISKGDYIVFFNSESRRLVCGVLRNERYSSVRELLKTEGTRYSLSSTNDLEAGIRSIESIADYKQIIPKHGVCAIELKKCGPFARAAALFRARLFKNRVVAEPGTSY